jgi:hypothetical protein
MHTSRLRAAALTALAAAIAVAVPATTAAAATTPIVGGGSFARTIPFIDGSIVAYECHAAAPGAVSTTVNSCVLNSVFGPVPAPPSTSPGPAAATSGAVSLDPATYQVCWTVSAQYVDGSTQSSSGCSTSGTLVGAG